MRVIIAGSRSFNDYETLKDQCNTILSQTEDIMIVSGTANGADKLGERFALEKGYPVKRFPADWTQHGKSAGYIRNEEMAKYSDMLIAFWDGESKGTQHMINLAKKYNLQIHIIIY
jgi:hypothetical protein